MIGLHDKLYRDRGILAYLNRSSLIVKDHHVALQRTPTCAVLRGALSGGLGLPWRLGPCTTLWVYGVIPPHLVRERFVSAEQRRIKLVKAV